MGRGNSVQRAYAFREREYSSNSCNAGSEVCVSEMCTLQLATVGRKERDSEHVIRAYKFSLSIDYTSARARTDLERDW